MLHNVTQCNVLNTPLFKLIERKLNSYLNFLFHGIIYTKSLAIGMLRLYYYPKIFYMNYPKKITKKNWSNFTKKRCEIINPKKVKATSLEVIVE